jgi:hypothetical protein
LVYALKLVGNDFTVSAQINERIGQIIDMRTELDRG